MKLLVSPMKKVNISFNDNFFEEDSSITPLRTVKSAVEEHFVGLHKKISHNSSTQMILIGVVELKILAILFILPITVSIVPISLVPHVIFLLQLNALSLVPKIFVLTSWMPTCQPW